MAPRTSYVSEYLLVLADDTDPAAPGAAITRALCGHWEHDGACRWPHHTATAPVATADDGGVGTTTDDGGDDGEEERGFLVRTVFVCPSSEEAEVRAGIAAGLRDGTHPPAPPGWSVRGRTQSSELTANELELAARLNRA